MRKIILLVAFSLSFQLKAAEQVMSLSSLINEANQSSTNYKTIDLTNEATQLEIESRNAGLLSLLVFDASKTEDKRDSFTNFTNRQVNSTLMGLSLIKDFSTGTELSLGADYEMASQNTFTTVPLYRTEWNLGISQQLWGNFFGQQTRYKQESYKAELETRRLDLVLQRQSITQRIESLYWDYSLLEQQRLIQEDNLKKSEQILGWTQQRVRNQAARDTDLLQAKALVATRRYDLTDVNNQIADIKSQFEQLIPGFKNQDWKPNTTEIAEQRGGANGAELINLTYKSEQVTENKVVTLDSLSAAYRLKQSEYNLLSTNEDLKPSLELYYNHGRNGVRDTVNDAFARSKENDTTYNQVGVTLTVDLDLGLNSKSRKAQKLLVEASKMNLENLKNNSDIGWQDLLRNYKTSSDQLALSKDLLKFQKSKSDQEQFYYRQGRSTAYQAITFALDASEAELRVLRLQNQLRKLEAQARLFASSSKATGQE